MICALLAGAGVVPAGLSGQVLPAEREGRVGERQIVLITGSTDGLGREVARRVAATGAHVIVHGRNVERGRELVQEIMRTGTGSASFHAADLSSLAQVRAFADTLRRHHDRLDVLVNNAGIWRRTGERLVSEDGHELHFAVNYLAGFLLTHLLLPLLDHGGPARIINVASGAQAPMAFDDIMLERDYSGSRAYAQSKLAQIMFTIDLAEELRNRPITVVALHPATLMNTSMVQEAGVQARSTVDEGARAVMHLIASGAVSSGRYYNGTTPARAHESAYDADARQRLRELSRRLSGLD
jgi:NAD(P)-dependent dehydrogenase (short-subunit alcohol dehydrogenase family)